MPAPRAARKTLKNQLPRFQETLVSPLTFAPELPNLSTATLRRSLIGVWIIAMITSGVGAGLLIQSAHTTTFTAPGVPVATATVAVASLASGYTISPPASSLPRPLIVTAPVGITQERAVGFVQPGLASSQYQSAGQSNALQKFSHYGNIQGNIGTDPVQ